MLFHKSTQSIDQKTFDQLRRLYFFALGAVAVSALLSYNFTYQFLKNQEKDSHIVNIAGRQRMLSQKLTKISFHLAHPMLPQNKEELLAEMDRSMTTWQSTHIDLTQQSSRHRRLKLNTSKIETLFQFLEPQYQSLLHTFQSIYTQALTTEKIAENQSIIAELHKLPEQEDLYLINMDAIVNQYDLEAQKKVSDLKKLELIILGFILALLTFELVVILLPAARAVKKTLHQLVVAEQSAKKMAKEADKLSIIKEKSVRELKALSLALDKSLLFARILNDGTLLHFGDHFQKLYRTYTLEKNIKLTDVLCSIPAEQDFLNEIISEHGKTGWQGEVKTTTTFGDEIYLELTILPFQSYEDKRELLIIGREITERIKNQQKIEQLNKISFDAKMSKQQDISKMIIENQEREQNRIAKDIHDGIGQVLTALKFNLESIDLSQLEKADQKIENIKKLTDDLIKGVRVATVNLTPPELIDYGLVPALQKLTNEISNLTNQKIILINKTEFHQRLEGLVEINIYRIVQEAVNNAIKYASASLILVSLSHDDQMLSVLIDDNGKGFDFQSLQSNEEGDSHMGITNMKERTKYINSRIFIHSSPKQGTRITLNVPLA